MPTAIAQMQVRFIQAKLPIWMNIDTELTQGERPRKGMISARKASEILKLASNTVGALLKDGKAGEKLRDAVIDRFFGGSHDAFKRAVLEWVEQESERNGTGRAIGPALEAMAEMPSLLAWLETEGGGTPVSELFKVVEVIVSGRAAAYSASNDFRGQTVPSGGWAGLFTDVREDRVRERPPDPLGIEKMRAIDGPARKIDLGRKAPT